MIWLCLIMLVVGIILFVVGNEELIEAMIFTGTVFIIVGLALTIYILTHSNKEDGQSTYNEVINQYHLADKGFAYIEGESEKALNERVLPFLQAYNKKLRNKNKDRAESVAQLAKGPVSGDALATNLEASYGSKAVNVDELNDPTAYKLPEQQLPGFNIHW